MKLKNLTALLLVACNFIACGQIFKKHKHQPLTAMDTNKLKNTAVHAALDAWQKGNSELWLSYCTSDAKFYDDGHSGDFKKFFTEAIGHERFTSIDNVEDNGTSVYGKFHSDTWGDFKTYFKFHLNNNGKIHQLEIGQTNY